VPAAKVSSTNAFSKDQQMNGFRVHNKAHFLCRGPKKKGKKRGSSHTTTPTYTNPAKPHKRV